MIISHKKFLVPMISIFSVLMLIVGILFFLFYTNDSVKPVMGGFIHENSHEEKISEPVYGKGEEDISERFQRPSNQPAYKLKYQAKDFIGDSNPKPPLIKNVFLKPEDVIEAYFALIKDAENMSGYHGGCGTIGWAEIPFPYAYELLSPETRADMSLDKFIESFSGVGHTTLLKLLPAYQPPDTPENIKYYMIETEIITGVPVTENNKNQNQPGLFAYYYGLVTTEKTPQNGWKIKRIDYIPEDFLCHPMHHWDYDARFLVGIVYQNWYGLVDEIKKVENKYPFIYVYAEGKGIKYRFDFVRLTNGDDLLMHENVFENGRWKEVNILKDEHQMYKFSILNPRLDPEYYKKPPGGYFKK